MKKLTSFAPAILLMGAVFTSATAVAQVIQVPAGQVKTMPEGLQTKAQIMASRVSHFASAATPRAGGGFTMTGVCDGDHKFKIQGRKDGTTGPNTMGQAAIMFEIEAICNKPDVTNPSSYAPVAGKTNVFTYDTNMRLSSTPTAASPGVAAGAWTINASQMGGTSAPTQTVTLPAYPHTF